MWGPGGISCGVRFVCHAITAMGGLNSLTSYNNLKSLPSDLLDRFEHGNTLLLGLQINGMVGTALFAWNMLQFLVSPFIRGVLLFLTGIIDLGFAIVLIVGCVKVATFLPNSNGKCGGALDWKTTEDGWNLFNELVWEGHYYTATGACESMLLAWIMTIVSIVFYYIVGIVNMTIGYFGVMPDKYGTMRSWESFPRFDLPKCIAAPIFTPVAVVVNAGIGSLIFISRLFCRACRRLMVPSQRIVQSGWNQIQNMSPRRNSPTGPCSVGSASTVTLPLEIVRMIAQHAHHADLISVSQSSRVLRTGFFGDLDVKATLDGLKEFTCDSERSSCDVCRSQICPSCTVDDRRVKTSTTLRHLKLCKPHCTSCYWDLRCGPERWEKYSRSPHHERHCHVTDVGSTCTSMSEPRAYYYARPPQEPAAARICRLCLDKPVAFRRRVLEAGDKATAERAWQASLQCATCTSPLVRWDLVWWVCSWCGGDCADGMHLLTGPGKG